MKNFIVWIIYLIFVSEFIFNSICYEFVYYYDKRIINEFGFDSFINYIKRIETNIHLINESNSNPKILIHLINELNANPQNFDPIHLEFDSIIRFATPT